MKNPADSKRRRGLVARVGLNEIAKHLLDDFETPEQRRQWVANMGLNYSDMKARVLSVHEQRQKRAAA